MPEYPPADSGSRNDSFAKRRLVNPQDVVGSNVIESVSIDRNHQRLAQIVARITGPAQVAGLLAFALLVWGLLVYPSVTLPIFWKVVVPILPVTFLVSPIIWRSVCPLATLNMVGNRAVATGKISSSSRPAVEVAGIGLLLLIVPARIVLFNDNGSALGILLVLVAILALGSGFYFQRKAGFCNSICPVLPVEKLYGQYPLVSLDNPRCADCTLCTAKGCIDLGPSKSLGHSLRGAKGRSGSSLEWLTTPYGIFAASFPGFVLGYFISSRLVSESLWMPFVGVIGFAVFAYAVSAVTIRLTRVSRPQATVVLAALAVGIYYWFAIPDTLTVIGIPGNGLGVTRVIQLVLLAFVAIWGFRGFRASENRVRSGL